MKLSRMNCQYKKLTSALENWSDFLIKKSKVLACVCKNFREVNYYSWGAFWQEISILKFFNVCEHAMTATKGRCEVEIAVL